MDAIHTVHAGDSLLSPSITRRLIEHVATSASPHAAPTTVLADLTPREREMLTLIARGLSSKHESCGGPITPHSPATGRRRADAERRAPMP